jgi:hypothetical protein
MVIVILQSQAATAIFRRDPLYRQAKVAAFGRFTVASWLELAFLLAYGTSASEAS